MPFLPAVHNWEPAVEDPKVAEVAVVDVDDIAAEVDTRIAAVVAAWRKWRAMESG